MSDETLDLLLSGVTKEADRKAVTVAYYEFATGDPNTFPVQFAILLKAHAFALKVAPNRLQKTIAAEVHKMSDLLVAHQDAVKKTANALGLSPTSQKADSKEVLDAVAALSQQIQHYFARERAALKEQLDQTQRISIVNDKAIELLANLSAHRIIVGLGLAYVAGLLSLPVFQQILSLLMSLIRK
jgi:negative regulator of replication initiation